MTVRSLWVAGRDLTVTGVGHAPEGHILGNGDDVIDARDEDVRALLRALGLCNDARLLPPNSGSPQWTLLGDPTEAALQVVATKGGVNLAQEALQYPRVRELPFNSRRKLMTTIHQSLVVSSLSSEDIGFPPSQQRTENCQVTTVFVKGAPKEVLALCTHIKRNGETVPLDNAVRAQILSANDDYARKGLRVLAAAQRALPRALPQYTSATVENDLTFLGLVAMMDSPRPEVTEAIETCHRAGIRVIMITGDYGLTAESIARRIGIVRSHQPRLITGADLAGMNDAELRQALTDEVIFARVAPEHKLRVVTTLQALGHVVAVTGDGVNDAPALKKADIGVAMGLAGTDVAKEAADMILTDDNFASIVNAVEEGRAVYANIKKFLTYIFTSNTPEAVPFIVFAFSGGRIPLALNVMQI
jgi:Ca2+-transporting ATPase